MGSINFKANLTLITEGDNKFKRGTYKGKKWSIRYHELGFLCGYVSIDKDSPLHNKNYYYINPKGIEEDINDIKVHGGLTFAGKIEELNNEYSLGFDCAHSGDKMLNDKFPSEGVYRDENFVLNEIKELIEQIISIEKKYTN